MPLIAKPYNPPPGTPGSGALPLPASSLPDDFVYQHPLPVVQIETEPASGVYVSLDLETAPLDWSEIDFAELHRKKTDILRAAAADDAVLESLDEAEGGLALVQPVFERLAAEATAHQAEAAYWSLAADMKRVDAQIVRRELTDDDFGDQLDAWRDLGPRMRQVLSPFMEDHSVRRAMDMWWAPTVQAHAESSRRVTDPA